MHINGDTALICASVPCLLPSPPVLLICSISHFHIVIVLCMFIENISFAVGECVFVLDVILVSLLLLCNQRKTKLTVD